MTPGKETERAYSYNPGTYAGTRAMKKHSIGNVNAACHLDYKIQFCWHSTNVMFYAKSTSLREVNIYVWSDCGSRQEFQKASLNTIQFPTVQHWNAINLTWQTDHYYTAQATWTDLLRESTDTSFQSYHMDLHARTDAATKYFEVS